MSIYLTPATATTSAMVSTTYPAAPVTALDFRKYCLYSPIPCPVARKIAVWTFAELSHLLDVGFEKKNKHKNSLQFLARAMVISRNDDKSLVTKLAECIDRRLRDTLRRTSRFSVSLVESRLNTLDITDISPRLRNNAIKSFVKQVRNQVLQYELSSDEDDEDETISVGFSDWDSETDSF